MTSSGDLGPLISLFAPIVIFIIVVYVVFRLVFLKNPPESKPSMERHGKN